MEHRRSREGKLALAPVLSFARRWCLRNALCAAIAFLWAHAGLGWSTAAGAGLQSTEAGAGAAASIESTAPVRVEVRLVDRNTGVGVAGMLFSITKPGADRVSANVCTEGDGTARTELPPGKYAAYIKHVLDEDRKPWGLDRALVVESGRTCHVEIPLVPDKALSGIVFDPAGRPVEGAVVALSITTWKPARSDASGRFEVLLVGERDATLWEERYAAEAPDRRLVGTGPIDAGVRELTIRLRQAGSIGGRIVDEKGAPIGGAKVRAWRLESKPVPPRMVGSVSFSTTLTGADGRYELKCVPATTDLYIQAEAPGHERKAIPFPMNDTEGTTVEAGDLQLAAFG